MQRIHYRCMVFNQIGLKPVCSTKSNLDLVFFYEKKLPVVGYLIIKRPIRQLGGEMVWGRNDTDSGELSCLLRLANPE